MAETGSATDSQDRSPRANPELIGHDEAERLLGQATTAGRLHHAWLFTGPKGVGKATLAFRFARFLLARDREEGQGGLFGEGQKPNSLAVDPDHAVFRRVAAGGHADLLTVERATDPKTGRMRAEIVVDDAREAARFFHKTAAEGGWRIAIVDSADEMNRHAANAVLKILEEPPKRSLLLLISHAPGRLLPTIRSRCTILPLKRLGNDQVATVLGAHRPDLAEPQRAQLAGLADGSPGRAIALADAGGLSVYESLVDLLRPLPDLDVVAAQAFADRFARGTGTSGGAAENFATVCDLLGWWLARLVRTGAAVEDIEDRDIVDGDKALLHRLGRHGGLDRWARLWEKSVRLFAQEDSVNLDRKQVLLAALFDIQAAAAQP